MNKLPKELYFDIIKHSNITEVKNICNQNNQFRNFCKQYKSNISKMLLDRYNVHYNDPTDFVYIMNNVDKNDYILPESDKYKKRINYHGILKLYLKFYNTTYIICIGKNITNIPSYPNLEQLLCGNNKLTRLPNYRKLKYLNCGSNQLTQLPIYPKLTELQCNNNQLTQLHDYPKLTELYCNNNLLTQLPNYPKLEYLKCNDNQLTQLPNYPDLKNLECYNNRITQFANYRLVTFAIINSQRIPQSEKDILLGLIKNIDDN